MTRLQTGFCVCLFVVVCLFCLLADNQAYSAQTFTDRFCKECLPGMCANMFPECPHTWSIASSLLHPGSSKGQQCHCSKTWAVSAAEKAF